MRRLDLVLTAALTLAIGVLAWMLDGQHVGPAHAQVGNVVPTNPGIFARPLIVTGNTNRATYSSAVVNFSNSSAGDVYCVYGSATNLIKVKGVRVSAVASAAVNEDVVIILRASQDTGGTPTSVAVVAQDQADPPPTATVVAYGTAPTAGTSVGTIRAQKMSIPTVSSTTLSPTPALFQFSVYWDQAVQLRGTGQGMCVNVSATSGGAWDIDEEHTEESVTQ